jgi:hypothetical protein
MRSVLLQLHIGKPIECVAWSNVATANGVQITVYVNPGVSTDTEQCAYTCFLLLARSLISIGGITGMAPCYKDYGHIWQAYTSGGAVHGLHKRVFIYIADGSQAIDPRMDNYFASSNSTIIPIIDKSIGNNPATILPDSFNTTIAEYIENFDPSQVILRIIRAAGIQSKEFRLFISYKQIGAFSNNNFYG